MRSTKHRAYFADQTRYAMFGSPKFAMRKYETYSTKEVILVCGDSYNLQIALWMSSDLNHSKFCLWSSVAPDMNCQSIAMRFLIKNALLNRTVWHDGSSCWGLFECISSYSQGIKLTSDALLDVVFGNGAHYSLSVVCPCTSACIIINSFSLENINCTYTGICQSHGTSSCVIAALACLIRPFPSHLILSVFS